MDHLITRWLLKDMSYSLFDNLDKTFTLIVRASEPERSNTPVDMN